MNEINQDQLAGMIVEKLSGIFPSMNSWTQEAANKYRDAMAAGLRANKDVGNEQIQAGFKAILNGEYKNGFAPPINIFMKLCKSKVNNARYLPQAKPVQRTEQEAKELHDKGNEALAKIKGIIK